VFGFGMFRYAVEHMEDLLLNDKNFYGKLLEDVFIVLDKQL